MQHNCTREGYMCEHTQLVLMVCSVVVHRVTGDTEFTNALDPLPVTGREPLVPGTLRFVEGDR